MSAREDLARLRRIADLRLDLRLSRLRGASDACAATQADLGAVNESAEAGARADWADPRAAAWHERWAEGRRRALHQTLAGQMAERDEARREAAQAFGQAEALRAINDRHRAAAQLAKQRRS